MLHEAIPMVARFLYSSVRQNSVQGMRFQARVLLNVTRASPSFPLSSRSTLVLLRFALVSISLGIHAASTFVFLFISTVRALRLSCCYLIDPPVVLPCVAHQVVHPERAVFEPVGFREGAGRGAPPAADPVRLPRVHARTRLPEAVGRGRRPRQPRWVTKSLCLCRSRVLFFMVLLAAFSGVRFPCPLRSVSLPGHVCQTCAYWLGAQMCLGVCVCVWRTSQEAVARCEFNVSVAGFSKPSPLNPTRFPTFFLPVRALFYPLLSVSERRKVVDAAVYHPFVTLS